MNRQERRRAYRQMGIIKTMSKLPWNHPQRVEFRRRNREQGEAKHKATWEAIEKERYERMEHAGAEYMKKCKAEGYEGKELELLEEAFALELVRDKETWQEDKKTRKRLKKEALESKNKRLS